jgi:hypothetical protein
MVRIDVCNFEETSRSDTELYEQLQEQPSSNITAIVIAGTTPQDTNINLFYNYRSGHTLGDQSIPCLVSIIQNNQLYLEKLDLGSKHNLSYRSIC